MSQTELPILSSFGVYEIVNFVVILKEEDKLEWDATDLALNWIPNLATLPRNLYQLYPREEVVQIHLNVLHRTSMNVHIIRTKDIDQILKLGIDFSFEEGLKTVAVFFIEDKEVISNGLNKLIPLFSESIITSLHEDIIKCLESDDLFKNNVCKSNLDIVARLKDFLVKNTVPIDFEDDYKNEVFSTFSPNRMNHINYFQLNHSFGKFGDSETSVEYENRASSHVESAKLVENRREDLNLLNDDLLIVVPYDSPYLRDVNRELVQKYAKTEKDRDSRLAIQSYFDQLSVEQDDEYLSESYVQSELLQGFALAQKSKHVSILDNMALLHSSFKLTPAVRFPWKGKSFHQEVSFFDPANFNAAKDNASSERKLNSLGQLMYDAYPSELVEYLFEKERQVIAISDLPVEWMTQQGIPLSFKSDVCRLPENPARALMSQHCFNLNFKFEVTPEILSKTLVVCGDPKDKIISDGFKVIKDTVKIKDFEYFETDNLESLKKKIHEFQPELLIFYTHGVANKSNFQSELKIGDFRLTNEYIVENHISAPLVVIIACEVAPLYGYHNPIAQAFFEAGAFSVTGPVLPITSTQGANFCVKLIKLLREASKHGMHKNWLNFVSHICRSSIFDDHVSFLALNPKFNGKLKLKKNLLESEKLAWLMDLFQDKRDECYRNVKQKVATCFEESGLALDELNKHSYIAETLFFTHWGRSDLVVFQKWQEKTLENLHKLIEQT